MHRTILFVLILKACLASAQHPLCTYTNPGNCDVFYANTTSVYTGTAQQYFLCGPNTVLYDTIAVPSPTGDNCNYGMIDSACTVIYKGHHNGVADSKFWIKNYGTLILKSSGAPVSIYAEPLATVVVQSTVSIFSYSCNPILLPSCAEVGLPENSLDRNRVTTFPNPNNGNFYIKADRISTNSEEIILYNNIGEEVLRQSTLFEGNISPPIKADLPDGIYFMKLRQKNEKFYYDKLVISK